MTFEEWFKDYIDNSSNKLVAMSFESQKLARAAWEAAQAEPKRLLHEIYEVWAGMERPVLIDEHTVRYLWHVIEEMRDLAAEGK